MIISQEVDDVLVVEEVLKRAIEDSVSDDLAIVDGTAAGVTSKPADDQLDLTESVSYTGSIFNPSPNDSLSLIEHVTSSIARACEIDPPVPPIEINATTVLSYPYTSPTHTATLRNPKFGNKQIEDGSAIIRKTRGGDQVVVKETTWLTTIYLEMSFEALTKTQRDALIALLEASAGDEIKLVDWENRTWRGIIVSDPNEIVQTKDDNFNYEASLKFEGDLIV